MDIESTIITALSFSPVIHNLGSTKTVIGLSFAENTNETKIIIFYESYCYLLGFSVTLNITNKNYGQKIGCGLLCIRFEH